MFWLIIPLENWNIIGHFKIKKAEKKERKISNLHHENDSVDSDEEENKELEAVRGDQTPHLVLEALLVLGNVNGHGLCVYRKVHAWLLIFVDLVLGKLLLTLLLKRDNDQCNEDVDKEERKHDEVYDVEEGHLHAAARHRAHVYLCWLDGMLQNTFQISKKK